MDGKNKMKAGRIPQVWLSVLQMQLLQEERWVLWPHSAGHAQEGSCDAGVTHGRRTQSLGFAYVSFGTQRDLLNIDGSAPSLTEI